jgi:hypothetical protein
MYPTGEQEQQMLLHCAHARYVWNLAVEQHSHWRKGRKTAPAFAEQCRQLTEARRGNEWLGAGNADVQQQALKDFDKAKNARFTSGFGEPTWRKKYRHEGFRVIGTDRVAESNEDGTAKLNARTGKQVMGRSVVVQKLNKRWAQVKVPGCGWVRFRLTRAELPKAKTFRVNYRHGQWHIAFAVIPEPIDAPGTGDVIGIDRGVKITAALSDGRTRGHRSRPRVRSGVRRELPSRPPSTQAEPSRRGPWRPGRSYSGALHLDAMNHARSTVCGSTADGMGAGVGCGPAKAEAPCVQRSDRAQGDRYRSKQSTSIVLEVQCFQHCWNSTRLTLSQSPPTEIPTACLTEERSEPHPKGQQQIGQSSHEVTSGQPKEGCEKAT